eukprot:1157767-Pelagomonas_calceolata.AAC.9
MLLHNTLQVTASSAGTSGVPPAGTELPDEFFELTAEDYAAWARAAEAKKRVRERLWVGH